MDGRVERTRGHVSSQFEPHSGGQMQAISHSEVHLSTLASQKAAPLRSMCGCLIVIRDFFHSVLSVILNFLCCKYRANSEHSFLDTKLEALSLSLPFSLEEKKAIFRKLPPALQTIIREGFVKLDEERFTGNDDAILECCSQKSLCRYLCILVGLYECDVSKGVISRFEEQVVNCKGDLLTLFDQQPSWIQYMIVGIMPDNPKGAELMDKRKKLPTNLQKMIKFLEDRHDGIRKKRNRWIDRDQQRFIQDYQETPSFQLFSAPLKVRDAFEPRSPGFDD